MMSPIKQLGSRRQPEPVPCLANFLQRYPCLVNEIGRALRSACFLVVGAPRRPTTLQLLDNGLATGPSTKRWQQLDDSRPQVKQALCDVVSLATRSDSSFRVRVPVPSSAQGRSSKSS
jgi:hypothetical protein